VIPKEARKKFRAGLSVKRRRALMKRPRGLENLYVAKVLKRFRKLKKIILSEFNKEVRKDALEDQRVFDVIRLRLTELKTPNVEALGKKVVKTEVKKFHGLIGIKPNVQTKADIDKFVEFNTLRIQSQDFRVVNKIQTILKGSLGRRHEDVAKDITYFLGVEEKKAKLIARDQILTLQANITRRAHERVGIVEYIWTTAGDQRVRESHEELNNTKQRYDNPPEEGNPGDEINCRCIAFPVMPEGSEPKASVGAKASTIGGRGRGNRSLRSAVERIGGVSKSEFLKSGFRAAALLTGAFANVSVRKAQQIALGKAKVANAKEMPKSPKLPPIKVTIDADGTIELVDGRHRVLVARQAGATHIRAEVKKLNKRGKVVSTYLGPIPI
jgi:SPP1 gp7 family putative phage head morphogenesis protein